MVKSLKSRILLYTIIFTSIPIIIIGIYMFFNITKIVEKITFDRHMQILKIVEARADKLINDIEKTVEYINSEGNLILRKQLIKSVFTVSSSISNIFVLDSAGKIKFSFSKKGTESLDKASYSSECSFKDLSIDKKSCWSSMYLSEKDDTPSISYAYNLDKNNSLLVVIDLNVLNKLANEFKIPGGESLIRIIDQNGFFLVNTDHPEFVKLKKNIHKSNLYKKFISKNYKYKQIQFLDLEKKNSIAVYGVTQKLGWHVLVKETYNEIFEPIHTSIKIIIAFLIILLLITIYSAIKLSKSILKPLDILSINMSNTAKNTEVAQIFNVKYKELNSLIDSFSLMRQKIRNRENRILKEVEENKHKDLILNDQSKMASMGEMIANISHQWRQPLSLISTVATSMKIQNEMGSLTNQLITKNCTIINDQTQYLSQTIDDFTNFIKDSNTITNFELTKCINQFEILILPSIKSKNISIIKSLDDNINLNTYENELIQCFINIVNNAIDAMESMSSDKYIFFETKQDNEKIIIKIKDNAGGIPVDIINRIFEAYFTTKHESKGTGLGLNMTYNLITQGMKGYISVKNISYEYNSKVFTGACFTIELPLNIDL